MSSVAWRVVLVVSATRLSYNETKKTCISRPSLYHSWMSTLWSKKRNKEHLNFMNEFVRIRRYRSRSRIRWSRTDRNMHIVYMYVQLCTKRMMTQAGHDRIPSELKQARTHMHAHREIEQEHCYSLCRGENLETETRVWVCVGVCVYERERERSWENQVNRRTLTMRRDMRKLTVDANTKSLEVIPG